jgi:hypothetical protein
MQCPEFSTDCVIAFAQHGKREIECLLNDNHQKGKMMIMIMKTSGSQVDSPVAEGKRKEGGGRKIRDLHRDT